MALSLVCPSDRHSLIVSGAGLRCAQCGRLYPIRNGVVRTLERPDDFYEGAYDNQTRLVPKSERIWHAWPLWLINSGYIWAVRRFVRPGATVVELGCAGGVRYFGRRYRMVGCDLSESSLKQAESYEWRIQANAARCIPLPDGSADAVVSSYFWEHIPPEEKPEILAECARILRPGGRLIFLYDVATSNPLIRRLREYDDGQYQEQFIRCDGHVGYQTPAANLTMFKGAGFRLIAHRGLEKTWVQSPSVYAKLAQFRSPHRRWLAWAERLGQHPYFYAYTGLVRLVDSMICPWLPTDWARINLVVVGR